MSESRPQDRPIIFVVVTPRFIDDWENLQRALDVLSQQDQGMTITTEPTERQVIISALGWLHLEMICDQLIREFKIPLDVGSPRLYTLRPFGSNPKQRSSTYDMWAGVANMLMSS
jgi:elongation factor G